MASETSSADRGLPVTTTCFRCHGTLPRSSHVFSVVDGVRVPFCSEDCQRATEREWPFDVEHVGVTITPDLSAWLNRAR